MQQLPRSHHNTSWAQNTLGLAYFHHHQYKASLKYFAASHRADPCRLQGAEFYSTVMWILKMEHELAALAQHCLTISRMRPESWCVDGRCAVVFVGVIIVIINIIIIINIVIIIITVIIIIIIIDSILTIIIVVLILNVVVIIIVIVL